MSLLSCDNKIGENVYVEVWNEGYKLHIDKQCENISKNHMVEFVKTKDLVDKYARTPLLSLCPKCVSDENADKLKSFIENNQVQPEARRTMLYDEKGKTCRQLHEQL